MASGGGGFRQLGAWRYGMELAVLVFDLTEGVDAEVADALRLAALEVPQRIAVGATEGRPKPWRRCLELAAAALDRVEVEARRLWDLHDRRFTELVAEVRRELEALQEATQQRLDEPEEAAA